MGGSTRLDPVLVRTVILLGVCLKQIQIDCDKYQWSAMRFIGDE